MSNSLKITCPNCQETFDAGSAFNDHINQAKLENEKKFKSQLEGKNKEIEKAKKDAEKKAQLDAEKKFKSQLEGKNKEIEKAKKEVEKKVKDNFINQFEDKIQKKDDELEKIKKAKEITDKRLAQKLEEINKMRKQESMELQGEIQEERLQDFLRKTFPDDTVEEIKKGVKGGDCILTINYKGKSNVAKIYFESKDAKSFQEKWVDKLLTDMKDKGISNGVLVVSKSALPSDFDQLGGYVERYGNTITIIPLAFPIIHAIVSKIRSILIIKSNENNNHQVPAQMKKAWENLQSPNFILPVKSMISQVDAMEKLLKKDRESFQRSSAHKDRTIKEINDNILAMINSFYVNVGEIFPSDLLEHENNLLIENSSNNLPKRKDKLVIDNNKRKKNINQNISGDFLDKLKINIHDEWSLSIRTFVALKDLDIIYVGDLLEYTETNLLKSRNFGKKALDEINEYLKDYSLVLGTSIDDWPTIRAELKN